MRGILINNSVHTADGLGLVMTDRSISLPTPKTNYIDVPGRNGALDLSEALTNDIQYNNRELKFSFLWNGSRDSVLSLIDEVMLYHGRRVTVITDDHPDWYYSGRASLSYKDYRTHVTFEMTVDAEPFRSAVKEKVINITVNGSRQIDIVNVGRRLIPTVTTSAETTIIKGEGRYVLSKGTFLLQGFALEHGKNSITIEGNTNVTIQFREVMI